MECSFWASAAGKCFLFLVFCSGMILGMCCTASGLLNSTCSASTAMKIPTGRYWIELFDNSPVWLCRILGYGGGFLIRLIPNMDLPVSYKPPPFPRSSLSHPLVGSFVSFKILHQVPSNFTSQSRNSLLVEENSQQYPLIVWTV